MNQFIKANWPAIYKAMQTPEGRGMIRSELKVLTKKIDEKLVEKFKEEEAAKEAARVKSIKDMPEGSVLWFTGSDSRLLGKEGKKVRDGRTRVVIDFGEHGRWNCLYTQITETEPSRTDMQVKRAILNAITGSK